jgi:hypothetical protein
MVRRRRLALLLCLVGCSGPVDPNNRKLSSEKLYSDFDTREIASDLIYFEPVHVLWSDGAVKRRWIRIPSGQTIDTSNLDRWRFPVGTQVFKEFSRNGVPLETRLIERIADTGDPRRDFWMGSFVWLPDGSDAVFRAEGAVNINGTDHDAPAADKCETCHIGEPGRLLGFSAVQLSGSAVFSLRDAKDLGILSQPPPLDDYGLPGDPPVRAALGYLHANCGHCHNPSGHSWSSTTMNLRAFASERGLAPEQTTIWQNTVNVPLQSFMKPGFAKRVVPASPDTSALLYRMSVRIEMEEMPPLATKHEDPTGVGVIRAWIEGIAP